MRLFSNILLLTGSKYNTSVFKQIVALIDNTGADLKLMHIGQPTFDQNHQQIGPYSSLHMDPFLRSYRAVNTNIHNVLKQYKVRMQSKAIRGEPLQTINNEIDRDHHDLIVVDASHKNIMQYHLATHVAMHLLRSCQLPVLVSRPDQKSNQVRIMAAVDPSESPGAFEMDGNALNEKIMALANAVVLKTQQRLHVVNCWQHPMMERMKNNKKLSNAKIQKILLEKRDQQKRRLTQFLNKSIDAQLNYRVYLRQGEPEHQIPAVARDNQIDMVILGSVGRTGLDGLMIGNTAENILCHTKISLLVVKPSEYQPVSIGAITPNEAACELIGANRW